MRVGHKHHTLFAHLLDAAVEDVFFQLEVGNPIAHQPADAVALLIHRHPVAGAAQLLRRRQSCRAASHHRHAAAGVVFGRLGLDPSLLPCAVHNAALDQLDGDGRLRDGQHACRLARRRTDAARKLRKVVGRVQPPDGIRPAAVVHQVVPVRDQVVQRTAGVAEGHAAVHAARSLLALLRLAEGLVDLHPVLQPLLDLAPRRLFPLDLKKTRDLTHAAPAQSPPEAANLRGKCGRWGRRRPPRRAQPPAPACVRAETP